MENKLEKLTEKNGGGSFLSISLAGILVIASVTILEKIEHNKLYPKVIEKADINKNILISDEEWKKVYDFLGKKYNPNHSNPQRDLHIGEMKKYLQTK